MSDFLYRTVDEERDELIVLSKEFVARTRINFTRPEILALYYVLKKIDPCQPNFSEISFSTSDFIRVLGLKKSGRQYQDTKKTLLSLKSRAFWMRVEGQTKEIAISIFDYLEVDTKTNIFTVRMNRELMPFFLQLKETIEFPYRVALEMKSVYSYPLINLIAQHKEEKTFTIELDALREYLSIPDAVYREYKEFRRSVLNKAIEGINEYSGLTVEMKSHTVGGKVTHITFNIEGELKRGNYLP